MKSNLQVMLLAGSAEARVLAQSLVAAGVKVRALVSETPRGPNPMPVPFALRTFDDVAGLVEDMRGLDAVVDASHGFDGAMTHAGYDAATRAGVPFVTLSRPTWDVAEDARWRAARDVRSAMGLIAPGARVFSATGWASLPECADFPGARLLLRQTTRHDRVPPYPFVEPVFGDPPFTLASERALFEALAVDTLICRNLGGLPSRPKLDAAKALGLKVILIDRPALPDGVAVVEDVARALDWVAAL